MSYDRLAPTISSKAKQIVGKMFDLRRSTSGRPVALAATSPSSPTSRSGAFAFHCQPAADIRP